MATSKATDPDQTNRLHEAIKKGEVTLVCKLLREGINPNSKDIYGQTPLKVAITCENEEIILELINKGADINGKDLSGQSDFQRMMQDGALPHDSVLSIVDSVNDLQERDNLSGESYLHLLRNRENDGKQTVSLLLKFLEKGVSINNQDFEGDTPLHNLASVANCQVIKSLLEHGADASILNYSGQTPLHSLADNSNYHSYPKALQILLDAGIRINASDKYGRTALHLVAGSRSSNGRSVTELMRHHINRNEQDKLGRNEVYHAIDKFDFSYEENEKEDLKEVIKELLNHGVNINQYDNFSMAPIHIAAGKHRYHPISVLLSLGADVNLKTRTGATALHLSTKRLFVYKSFIKLCKEREMDLSIADSFGSTPLHWAVWFREQTAVKMLLQYGADPDKRDNNGLTAADLAAKFQYEDYIALLREFDDLDEITYEEDVLFDFHGTDVFEECPHLSYIEKDGNSLDLETWTRHFRYHEESIGKFIKTVTASSYMGFYFDIDENKIIIDVVNHFMQLLCTKIQQRDPIFDCQMHMTGSVKESTKVNTPHEFDYVWNLKRFSDILEVSTSNDIPKGFVRLREATKNIKADEKLREYISEDGFLNGGKLKQRFSLIVNEAVIDLFECDDNDEFKCFSVGELCEEKQNRISNLQLIYYGQQIKQTIISIDLVLAVSPRDLTSHFLEIQNFPLVKSLDHKPELAVVLISPDGNFIGNRDRMFRVSLAFLEHEIISSLPFSVRKGYIIVKAIHDSRYMPTIVEPASGVDDVIGITTYMLKNCFLLELDRALNTDEISLCFDCDHDEKDEEVSKDWGRRIISRIETSVHNRNLPSYFHPEKNLLAIEGTELVFREPIYESLVSILKTLMQTIY